MESVTFDVVIVGAGIAGIATAYYLATELGITNILLVDKRPPMTNTSDKSGSNYRNWWTHPSMVELANHSIDLMDKLSSDQGNFFNINRRGYAYFSQSKDIAQDFETYSSSGAGEIRVHDTTLNSYQPQENTKHDGADVIIGNKLLKQIAPFVSDDIQSMVHVRRAGWLSTRVMAHHMLDTASQSGLIEMSGEVTQLEHDGQQSTLTVNTSQGTQTIKTTKLVLATGPGLPNFGKMLNLDFHVYNIMHQKVMLCGSKQVIPDNMPFMIFRDSPTVEWSDEELSYLEQHSESVSIPGNFHIRRVNDKWIHVGWAFNRQRKITLDEPHFDEMFPKVLLKGISSFIPSLKSFAEAIPQPIVVSGGYYTRTLENLPIIQETSLSGLYVIGALSGFGVMVGCGAGELLSRMIVGQAVPTYTGDFSLSRYDRPNYYNLMQSFSSGEL
jgi:glycine/D-amino acid oxidase-like deaminating enzyme